jgi:hypothetical protein
MSLYFFSNFWFLSHNALDKQCKWGASRFFFVPGLITSLSMATSSGRSDVASVNGELSKCSMHSSLLSLCKYSSVIRLNFACTGRHRLVCMIIIAVHSESFVVRIKPFHSEVMLHIIIEVGYS